MVSENVAGSGPGARYSAQGSRHRGPGPGQCKVLQESGPELSAVRGVCQGARIEVNAPTEWGRKVCRSARIKVNAPTEQWRMAM